MGKKWINCYISYELFTSWFVHGYACPSSSSVLPLLISPHLYMYIYLPISHKPSVGHWNQNGITQATDMNATRMNKAEEMHISLTGQKVLSSDMYTGSFHITHNAMHKVLGVCCQKYLASETSPIPKSSLMWMHDFHRSWHTSQWGWKNLCWSQILPY